MFDFLPKEFLLDNNPNFINWSTLGIILVKIHVEYYYLNYLIYMYRQELRGSFHENSKKKNHQIVKSVEYKKKGETSFGAGKI